MAGTFDIPGDGSAIVTFTFQADKDKVESVIDYCAKWLYKNHTGVYGTFDEDQMLLPFSTLTPQEKIDIINKFVGASVMETAFMEKGDTAARVAVTDGTLDIGE